MSCSERLERWVELPRTGSEPAPADAAPDRVSAVRARAVMRGDSSPITVAFEDPVLRAAGPGHRQWIIRVADQTRHGRKFEFLPCRYCHRHCCRQR